jgi:N-acyl homoserine lactone hydrolase
VTVGALMVLGDGFISSLSALSPFATVSWGGDTASAIAPSQFPLRPLDRSPTDAYERRQHPPRRTDACDAVTHGCRPPMRCVRSAWAIVRVSGIIDMRSLPIIAALLALPLLTQPAAAQAKAERLYVIECGSRTAPDVSPWTPGVNVGKPIDFVDTCYVIKHGNDWLVWDTGLPDAIFSTPLTDPFAWRRTNTLAGELDKIGIKPSDVKYLAVSHTHPDHIGNVELFPQAMLLVQQAEYDWPNQDGSPRFKPSHPVTKLQGDHDVFGDGSVTLLSTPGHTPGHQSLLI